MKVDLHKETGEHFRRIKALAVEAEQDDEEKYSSRAAAMSSLTAILKELTKTQESIINMERLTKIEAVVIEAVKQHLTPAQCDKFMQTLEEQLNFDGKSK